MRKYLLLIISLFIFPVVVNANSVSNIDMNIFIDDNGDATITEVWDAVLDSGTEGYHPYYNLGESYISDVSVSMDGNKFMTVDSWDIDASFEEKSNKAGIYYAGDSEYDICFGISSYGKHRYSISYKINNFIVKLNDADMLYWNLFPKDFNVSPDNIDITVYGNNDYSDDLDVWGYGKYGALAYVDDGKIHMHAEGINGNEYMTLLVKYPSGTFNTSYNIDNGFDYYLDMANSGSTTYVDNYDSNFFESIINGIMEFLPFILFILFGVAGGIYAKNSGTKYDFGQTGNKVRNDVNMFRDIPCNKDIYRAYWVAINYNLVKKKEDFLGAILLKWLMNGNVRIEKVMGGFIRKKEESNVVFINSPNDNYLEAKLYSWMVEASGDNKLESGEFKKWCKKNYSKITGYFDELLDFEKQELISQGKIKSTNEKRKTILTVDSSMMSEAEQMAGLKKFLKEFSVIDKREPIEVSLWNEYLIYAQIFGIADEVAKQFKKLYPEIMENMDQLGYNYEDIYFLSMISNTGVASAKSALEAVRNYSGGGGGFSAGGGGFGSFGGGGGGGGFR